MRQERPTAFKDLARESGDQGIVREFLGFLRHSRKWWLLPVLLLLLTIGTFLALSSTAVAPFIYALF